MKISRDRLKQIIFEEYAKLKERKITIKRPKDKDMEEQSGWATAAEVKTNIGQIAADPSRPRPAALGTGASTPAAGPPTTANAAPAIKPPPKAAPVKPMKPITPAKAPAKGAPIKPIKEQRPGQQRQRPTGQRQQRQPASRPQRPTTRPSPAPTTRPSPSPTTRPSPSPSPRSTGGRDSGGLSVSLGDVFRGIGSAVGSRPASPEAPAAAPEVPAAAASPKAPTTPAGAKAPAGAGAKAPAAWGAKEPAATKAPAAAAEPVYYGPEEAPPAAAASAAPAEAPQGEEGTADRVAAAVDRMDTLDPAASRPLENTPEDQAMHMRLNTGNVPAFNALGIDRGDADEVINSLPSDARVRTDPNSYADLTNPNTGENFTEEEARGMADLALAQNYATNSWNTIGRLRGWDTGAEEERPERPIFNENKGVSHACANHVAMKESGEKGTPINHTLLEDGSVTHYVVEFKDRIVEDIPAEELTVLEMNEHMHTGNRDDYEHDEEKPRVKYETKDQNLFNRLSEAFTRR